MLYKSAVVLFVGLTRWEDSEIFCVNLSGLLAWCQFFRKLPSPSLSLRYCILVRFSLLLAEIVLLDWGGVVLFFFLYNWWENVLSFNYTLVYLLCFWEHCYVVFDSVTGTEKVRQAQDCKDLHVVNPDWLWSCLERWDKVEEQLFPLKDDYIKTHR